MQLKNRDILETFYLSTPIGFLEMTVSENKLHSLEKAVSIKKKIKQKKLSPFALLVKQQIQDYFNKKLKIFDIPLHIETTNFQKKVLKYLQKVPWAKTVTYGDIALKIKYPLAARAVGQCCANNPFLIIIPCHRVVSKTGLGGFALGLKTKKYLLNLESK